MEIYDVVMRLIGPVEPVGETRTDNQRLASLEQLTGLVDGLLEEIRGIAERHEHSHEYSVKRAADLCDKFLRTVAEEFAQSPAPAAPAPTSQWQDIATAPKDGTEFLAWFPKMRLDDDDEMTDEVIGGAQAIVSCNGGMWNEPDWLDAHGSYYMEDWCFAESPTLWQPLPTPPLSGSPEDKPK